MGRWRCGVALLVVVTALVGCLTGTAAASPGALRIAILEAQCAAAKPASTLRAQLLANSEVAAVDFVDGATVVPTASQLLGYDAVVAMGDCSWIDAEATGNALADYEDRGGVVVGANFDWELRGAPEGFDLAGRWINGGYTPFLLSGEALPGTVTLVPGPANPLLEGVSGLSSSQHDELTLAPGATELAEWSNETPAVAVKGNALGINAYLGDAFESVQFSGDYAPLIVNAANVLGPRTLTVTRSGAGAGSVSSAPAGISCGAVCAFSFPHASAVTLTATPLAGSQFAGWSGGGCSGTAACTVTMTAAASVDARFEPSPPPVTCLVPKLSGKTVKAARRALVAAHCALGKVSPAKQRSGRIVKQRPAPGAVLPLNGTVSVKLKPRPRHRRGHAKGHR